MNGSLATGDSTTLPNGKQMFLLTATPVNNRLIDLQHMIELFSRHQTDYFKDAPLGIHSLAGHFRKMEKDLEKSLSGRKMGTKRLRQTSSKRKRSSHRMRFSASWSSSAAGPT